MNIEELEGGGTRAGPSAAPNRPSHTGWLLAATAVLALAAGYTLGQSATERRDPVETPSPASTPYPLVGTITFGPLANPETTFRLDQEVAWSAFLSESVESGRVDVVISERGDDPELFGYTQFVNPGTLVSANEMRVGRFIREPGGYVMRYVSTKTGEVLAEGEFELVRADYSN